MTVDVGEHGKVCSNSTTYTGKTVGSFQVWPGTLVSFLITPDTCYVVDVLTLSGADVSEKLRYGVYSTGVNHIETLVVRFVKSTTPPTPAPETSPTPIPFPSWYPNPTITPQTTVPSWQVPAPYGPKTGNASTVGTCTALLFLSAAAMIVLSQFRKAPSNNRKRD